MPIMYVFIPEIMLFDDNKSLISLIGKFSVDTGNGLNSALLNEEDVLYLINTYQYP